MGISDSVQTLVAAFSFGILLQAASGALFIHYKGHGSSLLQDGRRLVLVLFLFFAALWAQIEFLNLLLPVTSTTPCQATLIFSTLFDQLARVAVEQFLLWSVGYGKKVTAGRLLLQIVLLIRFVAGGVLVGFTRSDFAPTCVARISVLPISIVVLALDGIIISTLMVRALSLGMLRDIGGKSSNRQDGSRALVFSILGLVAWYGMSVPMILGIPSILLILRTVLPSNGMFILVGIMTLFSGSLMATSEEITTPEARSPFITPTGPSREVFKSNIGDGSPVSGHRYTKSGGLFVVNPSATPRDSPTVFQSSRGDTRGFTKLGDESTVSVKSLGKDGFDRVEPKNGPGYRGSSGIFPSPLSQGAQVAPLVKSEVGLAPIVAIAAIPAVAAAGQKRGFFNFSKAPPLKPSVRSLGISGPLVGADIGEPNVQPFARMATIDLAQAAANERERREGAIARSRLVANRPAPQPPTMSTKEALGKSISVKRKEVSSRLIQPAPVAPASGNTTSASLSPGREEVRRRSPRNANNFNFSTEEKELNPKTPLQRNPTLGLPSNPRSQRITMVRPGKTQTVMFMNDVVYDNPGVVDSIIKQAPKMYAAAHEAKAIEKSHWSPTTTLKSSNSVIHRPRPIKRNTEKELLAHRRSRSGSSIGNRKSVFMSAVGSPTNLPPLPLPPPPTSAANLRRLLQTDTKSMTFNEKIEFLFPAPPERQSVHRRRSSVPSSRVPSDFLADSPIQSPIEMTQENRTSKRTTIASSALLEMDKLSGSPKSPNRESSRQTYWFSANTYRNITNEVDAALIPPIPDMPIQQPSAQPSQLAVPKRRSVYDEIQKLKNLMKDKPYVPDRKSRQDHQMADGSVMKIEAEGKQVITIKLDSEETNESILPITDGNEISFFLEADQSYPGNKAPEPVWHRRIGDELPTFSGRKSATAARKMPPPTPLLLNRRGRAATVIVRNAEPSPPADSPGRAIEEIQAQLKRFEEPGRNSVSSLLKRLPKASSQPDARGSQLLANLEKEMGLQENHWQQNKANLDRDSMSSVTTATPRRDAISESDMSRESPQRSIKIPPRTLSRRARIRNSMLGRPKSPEGSSNRSTTTSSSSSNNSTASMWQQRLADAQLEYAGNATVLLGKKSLNFLAVSKAQIGSPTPPDTESDTELESDSDRMMTKGRPAAPIVHTERVTLWQAPLPLPKAAIGRMWNPPYESATVVSPEPPAKNMRPVQRRSELALPIFSFNLWSKPRVSKRNSVLGMWGSKSVRPQSVKARRASRTPTRKSRRITFLPDILESPVPLPNKDTLGIFQFPWGETSDQPVYTPAFNPVLPTAPIISAKLDSRSRELEPDASAYASSFFDDYDDEDQNIEMDDSDDDFDETTLWEIASLLQSKDVPSKLSLLPPARVNSIEDYDGSEDENKRAGKTAAPAVKLPIQPLTFSVKESSQLWSQDAELSAKAITGLPQPVPKVWDAIVARSEDSVQIRPRPGRPVSLLGSDELWTSSVSYPAEKTKSGLWMKDEPVSLALPTPAMWAPRVKGSEPHKKPAAQQISKAPRQITDKILPISSRNLWVKSETSKEKIIWISTPRSVERMDKSIYLWEPNTRIEVVSTVGLFNPSTAGSNLRSSELAPAAIDMTTKPRTSRTPLSELSSSQLWDESQKLPLERDWISESSVRPESPAFSSSSSGASSPISDASSVKSTSTKASSIWGSARSMIPTWWEPKSAKKTPATSPTADQARPSKLPVRQKSVKGTPLPSVRESRVLASRDLWEAKAPALEPSVKKFRSKTAAQRPALPAEQSLRHQHRLPVAIHRNWDEALAEAVAAGRRPLIRPISTKADWESALARAISLSQPRVERPRCTLAMWNAALDEALASSNASRAYNPAVLHPVYFTEALISSTVDVHPAALGHVVQKYDSAVLHPVFFAKSLVSDSNMIHPAALGHVVKKYDPAVLHPVFFTQSMATTSNSMHPAAIGHLKMSIQKNVMWTSNSVSNPARSGSSKNVGMWSMKQISVPTSADLFKHDMARSTEQTPKRQARIVRLESSELFKTTLKTQKHTHWLHKTSSNSIPADRTWIASSSSISPTERTGMWKTKSPQNQVENNLFQNPHSEPWVRSKRNEVPLAVFTNTDLWRPSRELPESPKNWLHKRAYSRVVFRY